MNFKIKEDGTISKGSALGFIIRILVIALPLLIACLFPNVFNIFGEAYVLTRGGPVYSTYTLMMYIYNEGMHYFNLGKASVASIVLIILAGSISALQFRLSGKWVNYDS